MVMLCLLNLNIPSLPMHSILCLLVCFPCRYLTLAPETAEETCVEISDTETEEPVGAPMTTLAGKGEIYTITLLDDPLRQMAQSHLKPCYHRKNLQF